ncbi:serine hydrolase domain-containing protein [Actinocrispum sp. NPDC049592]|uniref:serine hydrolase domain-containing protein n=1 Tax=Actinocrispum sp. NPDC049592 TaxID=3154835 RepID=UPI003419F6C3
MSRLHALLQTFVDEGTIPGAVALVARGSAMEVAAVGSRSVGGPPMTRDSIFRIASITKPVTAAAVMLLVEDGTLGLESEVREWLPELASPVVARTPSSELSDVVPAVRPITVVDLLTSRAGYGFADDFSLPSVQEIARTIQGDGRIPQNPPAPDEWMAILGRLPMTYQPGEKWLYNACSDIQGVLIARVSGKSFPEFLAERIFEPLGMTDTAFTVPEGKRDRFTSYYKSGLVLEDAPDGQWATMPAFPSGAGGLVSTVDDYFAFTRMLLGDGLLSAESKRLMMTNHLTREQQDSSKLFLDGQGWGFGGGVDTTLTDPWNVLGRYGWVGGTGTSAYVTPSTGTTGILLTQLGVDSPVAPKNLQAFWEYTTKF